MYCTLVYRYLYYSRFSQPDQLISRDAVHWTWETDFELLNPAMMHLRFQMWLDMNFFLQLTGKRFGFCPVSLEEKLKTDSLR